MSIEIYWLPLCNFNETGNLLIRSSSELEGNKSKKFTDFSDIEKSYDGARFVREATRWLFKTISTLSAAQNISGLRDRLGLAYVIRFLFC